VTAVRRGDGSSTICSNLSRLLAGSGRSVLLMDSNLRQPSLHRVFQVPNGTGLSTLLQSGGALEGTIHQVADGLALLPSGPPPQDPQRLLAGDSRLEQVLRAARRAFDAIVLDSPPVLESPDASLLATRADGIVVVMCAGRTTAAEALLVRKRLEQAGAVLWGSVLNNASLAGYAASEPPFPERLRESSGPEEAVAKAATGSLNRPVLTGEGLS
jgi:capsular exopolysaccharide synthesis family protein